jgi:hypothetical protein
MCLATWQLRIIQVISAHGHISLSWQSDFPGEQRGNGCCRQNMVNIDVIDGGARQVRDFRVVGILHDHEATMRLYLAQAVHPVIQCAG